MKEVLRAVRKEMMVLEENIPWDGVEKHWKVWGFHTVSHSPAS